MIPRGRMLAVWLAVLGIGAVPLVAQDQPVEDSETVAAEEEASPEADLEQIDEILEGEEEVLAGEGYSYDAGGRRDPFLSLLRRTRLDELPNQRPEGVPGLLIDEIDIEGIFELEGRMFAQIQTADKEKGFLVQEGDQLFDGEIVEITANQVVFKQIVNDPSIIKPFREVVKKLNPEP